MFATNQEIALFIVRFVVGSVFILHGAQKVFGIFGGSGLAGFANWLRTLGIPAWLGYVSAFVELVGGVMVLAGIFAPAAAAVLAVNMAAAIYLVHLPNGYFVQSGGWEYSFNLILLCVAIIFGYR